MSFFFFFYRELNANDNGRKNAEDFSYEIID